MKLWGLIIKNIKSETNSIEKSSLTFFVYYDLTPHTTTPSIEFQVKIQNHFKEFYSMNEHFVWHPLSITMKILYFLSNLIIQLDFLYV